MSKGSFTLFGIFAAICLVVIPYYAFAKEGNEDTAVVEIAAADDDARELFVNNCGYCHTLAAAGTDGVVGPDLDDLLVATGINSAEQYEGILTRVQNAVNCGIAGRMPKRILIGEESRQVASFVAAYAGQIGTGPTVDLETAETPEPGPCAESEDTAAANGG